MKEYFSWMNKMKLIFLVKFYKKRGNNYLFSNNIYNGKKIDEQIGYINEIEKCLGIECKIKNNKDIFYFIKDYKL